MGLYFVVFVLFNDWQEAFSASDFWKAFVRWDGFHYINIAGNGYANAIEDGKHLFLVFYPLYPWLIRLLELLLASYELAGIAVSVLCYAGGCCFFYCLTKGEYGDRAAWHAVLLISLFPFGFNFGMVMTESLYFLVGTAFLYYIRNKRWGFAAIWGFLACLTKVQAVLLFGAAVAEVFCVYKPLRLLKEKSYGRIIRDCIRPLCITAVMFGGTLIYLGINYAVEGDPLRFMYYQKTHWNNSLYPLHKTLGYIWENAGSGWFTSTAMALWIPELLLFLFYLAVIFYGIKRKVRASYMIYLISFFLLTYSSSWLISAGRYTLSAFPLFMIGGEWCGRHERAGQLWQLLSAALFIIFWIGNFMWKQIM